MDIRRMVALALELASDYCLELATEINPPKKRTRKPKPTAQPNWWEGVSPR